MTGARFSARTLCLVAFFFALVPAGRLFSQSSLGSISGNVVDTSGGSCASNVTVVNIDNGFGAGYVASLINRI